LGGGKQRKVRIGNGREGDGIVPQDSLDELAFLISNTILWIKKRQPREGGVIGRGAFWYWRVCPQNR